MIQMDNQHYTIQYEFSFPGGNIEKFDLVLDGKPLFLIEWLRESLYDEAG